MYIFFIYVSCNFCFTIDIIQGLLEFMYVIRVYFSFTNSTTGANFYWVMKMKQKPLSKISAILAYFSITNVSLFREVSFSVTLILVSNFGVVYLWFEDTGTELPNHQTSKKIAHFFKNCLYFSDSWRRRWRSYVKKKCLSKRTFSPYEWDHQSRNPE